MTLWPFARSSVNTWSEKPRSTRTSSGIHWWCTRGAATAAVDAASDAGRGAWEVPVPAAQFARVELMELLQQVGRLPAEQRETLLLAAVEEMRYEEIAATMSVPVGTVMSRLSRAREKLRRMADERPAPLKRVR